jgi:uncharacterized membrane protein YphA (DoxX/SURF4 family)
MNRFLWTLQILLALLFLFAGAAKFFMPMDQIVGQTHLSANFIYFIGVMEFLGGIGLILPQMLKIRPVLTPLAAAGLLIIMIGATVVTLQMGPPSGAILPAVTGILCAVVAWGRRRLAPQS